METQYFLTQTQISILSVFYVTINSLEKAQELSDLLLEKKLIACSNIVGTAENPIFSIYRWQGKIEKEKEFLIIIKSRTALLPEIFKAVKANHPYQVPEVVAMPILGGNPDYLKWVLDNTKEPETSSQEL